MDIIGITTSSDRGSVSVYAGGSFFTREFHSREVSHSSSLIPSIREMAEKAGREVRHFGGVAVDAGPGSFTGIRLAISCAEAFSLAVKMKKAGISSLDIIAEEARASLPPEGDGEFSVAIDAGRGEFYTSRFRSRSGLLEKLTPDTLAAEKEMAGTALRMPVFGYLQRRNTACPFREKIKNVLPHSEYLVTIALRKNEWQDDVLKPHYIRLPNVTVKGKPGPL